ncbi:MAG: Ppx/GppA phosphatase family protein [Candidatus Neomarinimicrobiota bacterium]|nr:Ppx/GppA phosphatase family protein [Candidatus Neomarinimicrobiota bacterium]
MRLASIDLGTNSLIMTIADMDNGVMTLVKEKIKIIRLGQALEPGSRLHPEAKERCITALRHFSEEMEHLDVDTVVAAGTAALRNASDGQEFADEVKDQLGIPLKVITGDDEARLTFKAIQHDFTHLGDSFVMIDIGGGSTELVMGDLNRITSQVSLDAGTVSFTERFVEHDPPTLMELQSASQTLTEMMDAYRLTSTDNIVIGVAGTVTTLKAVELEIDTYDHWLIHGTTLSREEVLRLEKLFVSMPTAERMKLKGLPPERADIIPMGAVILDSIMDRVQQQSITISDRGLRWGLLYERVERDG